MDAHSALTRLSVNVNKVATLRNTRTLGIPSVVHATRICLDAGAHGITLHPRPDERHITHTDVLEVADVLRAYPHAELNIEGNPFPEFMNLVQRVRPHQCTLVPDTPDAFTSDHGWDVVTNKPRLQAVTAQLHAIGCRVSLFLDADPDLIDAVKDVEADRIELYTEPFASRYALGDFERAIAPYTSTAERAAALMIDVNAGHDLNRDNLGYFLKHVRTVSEVSIGHALIADALEFGLDKTVRMYLDIIQQSA